MSGPPYKPDLAEILPRYTAWWRRENTDRCLATVRAPLDATPDDVAPRRPATPEAMWTDFAYSIYHLDGVGAFHLIEEVCRIENIHAVQVLPGAGQPSPLHFLDTLRTVQRMGKGLHITIPPGDVRDAPDLLSCRGLCIDTNARTETEARALIEDISRLSVDRG